MSAPVTIGERRRVERLLLSASAIKPEPPSGIPFSAIKLLSIVVLVYSLTLTIEAAWDNKLLGSSLLDFFIVDSPIFKLPWQALNIFMSVFLVIGTFRRSPSIVLMWLLYGLAADVYLSVTVLIQIFQLNIDHCLFFNIITILLLPTALWMMRRFYVEIHEDAQPDPDWDFYSQLLRRQVNYSHFMHNTEPSSPPPTANNSVV